MFNDEKIIIIDDPVTSLDSSRKSVVAYKIKKLFEDENNQTILLTHDLSLIEKIREYKNQDTIIHYLEMINEKNPFKELKLNDYLVDDNSVYRYFIDNIDENSNEVDRLVALMSMRPLVYINKKDKYKKIETKTSYFSHTLYAKDNKISFIDTDYNNAALRNLINDVNEIVSVDFDACKIVSIGYEFKGFEYENIK